MPAEHPEHPEHPEHRDDHLSQLAHARGRNAEHTQSVLTITSNVVYGKHTGNTPDGRRTGAGPSRRAPTR